MKRDFRAWFGPEGIMMRARGWLVGVAARIEAFAGDAWIGRTTEMREAWTRVIALGCAGMANRGGRTISWIALCVAVLAAEAAIGSARAETLEGALVQAYQNNPSLNAQRSALRATDENVAIALSGYRPRVTGTITGGATGQSQTTKNVTPSGVGTYTGSWDNIAPHSFGVTATQTLYNGGQTGNRTRQAESQVSAARETLRLTEQTVLLNAATAYMNVLRDTAILDLQRRNVEVLQEQLRQTRDRFNVGEVTKTDVAQAESRVAAGRSSMLGAESNLVTSRATYRQVVGIEPAKLTPGQPVDRFSPSNLKTAIDRGRLENPNVTAAALGVDVASLQVRINEGALYPTVTVQGTALYNAEPTPAIVKTMSYQALGTVSIPLFQGGSEYATIRQSKETLGQRRMDLDTQRDSAQQSVVQFWGQLEAAKAQIIATQAQVNAAETALNGVREEARVGQRTTLDVLNAQQELVNARVALVTAQRDRVVASYSLLSATGRLSTTGLGLRAAQYDPMVHYQQIRDSWFGVRTPDGR
jgi:outer membrane protein